MSRKIPSIKDRKSKDQNDKPEMGAIINNILVRALNNQLGAHVDTSKHLKSNWTQCSPKCSKHTEEERIFSNLFLQVFLKPVPMSYLFTPLITVFQILWQDYLLAWATRAPIRIWKRKWERQRTERLEKLWLSIFN